jgi:L-iditol 2-dehydrogenase
MIAVVKTKGGKGNIELRDMPEPVPGEGEVKIEVKAAGVCGSDIHIWDGDIKIPLKPPVIIGHEFSGVIADIGDGVRGFEVGQRVVSETTFSSCGICAYCRTGEYNLCDDRRVIGYWLNGAFTRFCIVPASRLHTLPPDIDFHSAALTEPLACCVHAVVELTGISAGNTVVVIGPGAMGLLAL